MKSSYTGQLPNMTMLDSDSNKPQKSSNVNKFSLVSLDKLRDDKYGSRLINNQCTFHKDNTPIMINPRHFKTGIRVMSLKQPMYRN